MNKTQKNEKSRLLVFLGLGTEIVGLILAAVWLGGILDERFHTKGLFLSLLSFLFLIGWMVHILVLIKRMKADEESGGKP